MKFKLLNSIIQPKTLLAIFVCSAVFLPHQALGEELRIVDAKGLVHFLSTMNGAVAVSVKVSQGTERCVLKHLDGVSSDLSSIPNQNGECVMSQVTFGTWQLQVIGAHGELPNGIKGVQLVRGTK